MRLYSSTPTDLQPALSIETTERLVVHDKFLEAHRHLHTKVVALASDCRPRSGLM